MYPAMSWTALCRDLKNRRVKGSAGMSKIMRLDRFIAGQISDISRSAAKQYCRQGRVLVNGKKAAFDQKIDAEVDEISVDGEKVRYKEHIYIMLNKPQGYVCSTRNGNSPTVLELVPKRLYRCGLFPAGRLDKDTEGFVLITDDGELSHKMLSPKSHVDKRYYVELKDDIREDTEDIFASGMTIDNNEVCLPAKLERVKDNDKACFLTLHEGKFHQVKRMFSQLGNEVVYLKRVSIGSMELDRNLTLGECLEILHKDIQKLLDKT